RDEKLSEEDTIQKAHRLEVTEGKRLSATEAQAVYGAAQLRSLRLQGYKLKAWETMEDERVRESHNLCQEQGAIPLGKPFHNGLQYPGDPNGGPEEVCNCRCNLVGVGVRS